MIKRPESLFAIVALLIQGCASSTSISTPFGSPISLGSSPSSASTDQAKQRFCSASPDSCLKVKGAMIAPDEIIQELGTTLEDRRKTLPPDSFRAWVSRETARVVTDRVTETLLVQTASANLTPQVETQISDFVEGELRRIITAEHQGVRRAYENELKAKGQTLDDVREKIRREVIISSYLDSELKPKVIDPTRAELVVAHQSRQQSAQTPDRRRMSLIEVRVTDRLPDDVTQPSREQLALARDEAQAKVEQAVQALDKGTPFAEVARSFSDDVRSEDGGAWGWVTRDSVRERFIPAINALFDLTQGQVSRIIERPECFFVVRCDEVEHATPTDFESMQPQLRAEHRQRQFSAMAAELIENLREDAGLTADGIERFHTVVVSRILARS